MTLSRHSDPGEFAGGRQKIPERTNVIARSRLSDTSRRSAAPECRPRKDRACHRATAPRRSPSARRADAQHNRPTLRPASHEYISVVNGSKIVPPGAAPVRALGVSSPHRPRDARGHDGLVPVASIIQMGLLNAWSRLSRHWRNFQGGSRNRTYPIPLLLARVCR